MRSRSIKILKKNSHQPRDHICFLYWSATSVFIGTMPNIRNLYMFLSTWIRHTCLHFILFPIGLCAIFEKCNKICHKIKYITQSRQSYTLIPNGTERSIYLTATVWRSVSPQISYVEILTPRDDSIREWELWEALTSWGQSLREWD